MLQHDEKTDDDDEDGDGDDGERTMTQIFFFFLLSCSLFFFFTSPFSPPIAHFVPLLFVLKTTLQKVATLLEEENRRLSLRSERRRR